MQSGAQLASASATSSQKIDVVVDVVARRRGKLARDSQHMHQLQRSCSGQQTTRATSPPSGGQF